VRGIAVLSTAVLSLVGMVSVLAMPAVVGAAGGGRGRHRGAHVPPRRNLVPVAAPELGDACDDLDLPAFAEAAETEAAKLEAIGGYLRIGDATVSHAEYAARTLRPLAQLARNADAEGGGAELCARLAERFTFYESPAAGEGKFTVYNNPVVRGSRRATEEFKYPLYRRPGSAALQRLSSRQILAGGLAHKGLELVWLSDLTQVHAIQIEGSATVELEDGSIVRLTCDGSNGRRYQNLGQLLLKDGKIPADQVTPLGMTRARKYFIDHPREFLKYWSKVPHYVFFKETGDEGRGAFGALVPGRSIAVDPTYVPLGAAVWLRSEKPIVAEDQVAGWEAYARLALAQDRGVAIVGPGRVDVFFGTSDYAQAASAVTNRPGRVYVLLAR
jgi:peptidoglycan lytic transglycosylase A